jgi:hypothetical protein
MLEEKEVSIISILSAGPIGKVNISEVGEGRNLVNGQHVSQMGIQQRKTGPYIFSPVLQSNIHLFVYQIQKMNSVASRVPLMSASRTGGFGK